jgi:hypothetical protein
MGQKQRRCFGAAAALMVLLPSTILYLDGPQAGQREK